MVTVPPSIMLEREGENEINSSSYPGLVCSCGNAGDICRLFGSNLVYAGAQSWEYLAGRTKTELLGNSVAAKVFSKSGNSGWGNRNY